jgi:hypothetical protein
MEGCFVLWRDDGVYDDTGCKGATLHGVWAHFDAFSRHKRRPKYLRLGIVDERWFVLRAIRIFNTSIFVYDISLSSIEHLL